MEIIDIDNLMLKLNESYLSLIKNTIIETHILKKRTLKFQQMLQIFMWGFFKVKTDLDTIQWKYMYSHKQLKYHIMIWHKPFQRSETGQKEGIHFFKNSTCSYCFHVWNWYGRMPRTSETKFIQKVFKRATMGVKRFEV